MLCTFQHKQLCHDPEYLISWGSGAADFISAFLSRLLRKYPYLLNFLACPLLPIYPHTQKEAENLRTDFVLGRKAVIYTPNFPMPRTLKVQVSLSTMTSAKQELETVPSVSSLWLLRVTKERIISRMDILLKIARMEIPPKTKNYQEHRTINKGN